MTAPPLVEQSSSPRIPSVEHVEIIQRRILWLAVRMVDVANRSTDTDVKIGGHQASSASMVSIMTALWFGHLSGDDNCRAAARNSPSITRPSICAGIWIGHT